MTVHINIDELLRKYELGVISKKDLGTLRRHKLISVLDDIIKSSPIQAIKWLDKKRSKISTAKLAESVGFDTQTDTIRQSFKALVSQYEDELRKNGIITTDKKTNIEVGEGNVKAFSTFLNNRLKDNSYYWPKNNKGGIYRRIIWAYFIDVSPELVKSAPSFFTRNIAIKTQLEEIDLMIVNDQIKTLDYSSASALDEMSDTMLSRALSNIRLELKNTKTELFLLREQNADFEQQLKEYESKEKALIAKGINAFKAGSSH
ncbi:hypothetical protein [Colwellia psychrerythraea]|uniref:Uncharacterized protein n=1 Tax=Colwellia psychrerythraea TaxID=28229 RepID=A0A099KJ90_COLPS|nr:hypothetical protein [Colwellia psychrerythraea]KGJ89613.1 hypothetical protein ND2E_3804 [Colwellia psychrerythraea]